MMICRFCKVRGRVQGVFYRASAQQRAHELGVNGWAHNCADGSVEVLACGGEDAVNEFCQWLWTGSPSSKVTHVECEEQPFTKISGFTSS
jgi:acylphosphatase